MVAPHLAGLEQNPEQLLSWGSMNDLLPWLPVSCDTVVLLVFSSAYSKVPGRGVDRELRGEGCLTPQTTSPALSSSLGSTGGTRVLPPLVSERDSSWRLHDEKTLAQAWGLGFPGLSGQTVP